jgi:hypothetical protein
VLYKKQLKNILKYLVQLTETKNMEKLGKNSKTRSGTILLKGENYKQLIIIAVIGVLAVPLPFHNTPSNRCERGFCVPPSGTVAFHFVKRKQYCKSSSYKTNGTVVGRFLNG